MKRPKLTDKDYKALVREIGKLETRFGRTPTRGAMQRYLNHRKEQAKREREIVKLRSELVELEAKSG